MKKLAEKNIESSIRDMVAALEKNEVDKVLTFFADNAVWYAPEGEFKGKDEIRRYITWLTSTGRVEKFEDAGIGIIVKGNKAVYEYVCEAIFEGTPIREPGVCLYEFSDGKCVYHRSIFDRISGAKQGVTGFIAKRVVTTVLDQLEEGLR